MTSISSCNKVTGWASDWGEDNSRCRLEPRHEGKCRPNLRNWRKTIDWKGPATDIWDALSEVWDEKNPGRDTDSLEVLAEQEEWIERQIGCFIQ